MNQNQKKLVEMWFVIIGLFTIVGVFEHNPIIARGVFIPFIIYYYLNRNKIKAFESSALTVKEIILNSKSMSFLAIGYLFIAIIVSFYFLFSGKDLGEYINNFWSLVAALGFPLIAPIIVSQKLLFKELGKSEL